EAGTATVEAGMAVQALQEAVAPHGLIYPLSFGARGTATIGGTLATNAGGANVLRHGSARALCLGLEAVLPDGTVADLLSGLRKDNTGYALRDLLIGAEGTLGIVTAATLRLAPAPVAVETGMIALDRIEDALPILAALQAETGGGVEAFELLPAAYHARYAARHPGRRAPLDGDPPFTVLFEVASTRASDRAVLGGIVEGVLVAQIEAGRATDVVIAQGEGQRAALWARREAAAELTFDGRPVVDTDVAVPLEAVAAFVRDAGAAVARIDPGEAFYISHLGDGNLHYTIYPEAPERSEAIRAAIEEVVVAHRGSVSAEHGVGTSKLGSMARHKDFGALAAMRAIKAALDPEGLMNPGKVLPAR
ncbi:MAG: FAD-binding oxidoreductase, partial [Shimia sp.]